MIHPVVLCGGCGTRLWPSSRRAYPKQFIGLLGKETLFQSTLKRVSGPEFDAPIVMTNAEFRFIATEQCNDIGLTDARVVIEPAHRDTGPAVLAAALMLQDTPEALMLVVPSDHILADRDGFLQALTTGVTAAGQGQLVTFGVTPTHAETGYGYLDLDGDATDAGTAHPVKAFVEKPDGETAARLIATGTHLWNSGMFLFRVGDIIKAFETHAPDIVGPCRTAIETGAEDLGFFRLGGAAYEQARASSIDFAVMEHADNIVAVPLSSPWSDLGSWDTLWAQSQQDADGVVTQGGAMAIECRQTLLRSEEPDIQLVGVGLDNIVAVAMRDAVLVADITASQQVKHAVTAMQAASIAQADHHPRFHRPWGWYETLCLGDRFRVKRIVVNPDGVLSLQSHLHRSEHWIVVAGTAHATVGDEQRLISENQSIYIPLGVVHRLSNPGQVPMHLIEVQTGAYLGEDDITRFEDAYDRTSGNTSDI